MLTGRGGHRSEDSAVRHGDLVADGRLETGDTDRLDNAAIANTIADIALSAAPPTNIALFGPWGSGKSSIYSMIQARINALDAKTSVVRYDAWKYGGRDLKRNFISSLANDLKIEDAAFGSELVVDGESSKLHLDTWVRKNWLSLLIGLGLAVLLATFWVIALAVAESWLTHVGFSGAAKGLVAASGTVFGLALAALIVGPKVLDGAVLRTVRPAPTGDDEFSARFGKLLKAAGIKDNRRLVVFVDELDRCAPADVVATLIDLKTFLEHPGCVFIVAVDRAVVEEALDKVPQAKPVRDGEPYYATRGAFLDKVFQHQIALPPLRARTLTVFARELVNEQDGLWRELRDQDPALFDLVVFALVPVHVRSPRRVKVLLNAYATNVRIAQSRGIAWPGRASEIAVLTVLQTEFPEVATDLVRVPRLLTFLRGEPLDDAPEVRRVVGRYRPVRDAESLTGEPPATSTESPASATQSVELTNPTGELLQSKHDGLRADEARQTSYTQLSA